MLNDLLLKFPILYKIVSKINDNNGEAIVVGGYVRDSILGVASKDIDIEVYGLSVDKLKEVLSEFGNVEAVGVSFGVLKLRVSGQEFDFSLPRTESKSGQGHKGFIVSTNENMNYIDAAGRRDFTINSMGVNLRTGMLLDPYDGYQDLFNHTLSATTDNFKDDPLRPLRALQFCGRFDLQADHRTSKMCYELLSEYPSLSIERIWTEWEKWARLSIKPSAGLLFLLDSGWASLYPEFNNLSEVKQNPVWHPEIFAGLHTMYVCDAAAEIATRENLSNDDRLILMFSALLHDSAKFTHSQGEYPNVTSYGHDLAGEPLAENFLKSIGAPQWLIPHVKSLIRCHMRHGNCKTDKAVRKLAVDLEPSNIYMLSLLIECDYSGRPPLPKGLPDKAKAMLELSKQEKVYTSKQKRVVDGKTLKNLGISPGPIYGEIIARAYQAQMNSEFNNIEGALKWLQSNQNLS